MKFEKRMLDIKTLRRLALTALLLNVTAVHAVPTTECFDLGDAVVGTMYTPGMMVVFPAGTVEFFELLGPDGAPAVFGNIEVSAAVIAGGVAPELLMDSGRMKITLNQPASRVTLDIANNTGGAQLVNIGANGEGIQLEDGLGIEFKNGIEKVDGLILGDNRIGQVRVLIPTLVLHDANWYNGQIKFKAESGLIESFSIGGNAHKYDNLCITTP